MQGKVCRRPKYTRLVKRPTPTINTGKPSNTQRPASTPVENWTHSHKFDTGVVNYIFHCSIFLKTRAQGRPHRSTYSPLSCTLLFDWWLLCILLLVLPSSTNQQLGGDKDIVISNQTGKTNQARIMFVFLVFLLTFCQFKKNNNKNLQRRV